ncbi:PilW family protein [Fervidicella metallireducens]|uniref:PilW family protein n=1 Tax=Fervidicella metallireducens TaxID=655338 RepID=UPI001377D218|nr:prepilin-type N-terminal cleavage/methylation domain-containing protein [Fervidicella metallireducens]
MKKKGLTLIELLVSLAIMAVLFAAVTGIFTTGLKLYGAGEIQSEVLRDTRTAILKISDDIKKGVMFINTDDFQNAQGNIYFSDVKNKVTKLLEDYNEKYSLNYIPLLFIEQLNGENYLYAVETKIEDNKTFYKLHRIHLRVSDNLQYNYYYSNTDNNPVENFDLDKIKFGIIDSYEARYFKNNYKIKSSLIKIKNENILPSDRYGNYTKSISIELYGNIINDAITCPFDYYQGKDVFRCVYDKEKSVFKSIKLEKMPLSLNEIDKSDDELMSENLCAMPLIKPEDSNKSYNIEIIVGKFNKNTGYTYQKRLSTKVAVGNYGGDIDDE